MNTTHDQQPAARQTGDPLDRAFAWLRSLGIMRDPADRWLGGVCSGIAHRLGVDPVIVRIALIVLTVMGGIGLPAYLVAWALLPDTAGEIKAESGIRHGDGTGILLLVAAGLSLGSIFTFDGNGWQFGWIIPVAVIAFFVSRRRGYHPGMHHNLHRRATDAPNAGTAVPPRPTWADGSAPDAPADGSSESSSFWTQVGESGPVGYDQSRPQPAPPAPARPSQRRRKGRRSMGGRGGLVVLGLAVAAYGLGHVLDAPTGFPGTADVLGRILALGVIALGVIVAALRGRTSGFPGFVGVVLAVTTAATIASPSFDWDFEGNLGDRVERPVDGQTSIEYPGGMGDLTVDLSQLSTDPTTAPTIKVDSGLGDVTIEIPKGLTVQLDADQGMGEVKNEDGDVVPAHQLIGAGTADVTIKADARMGDIIVKEMP